MIILGRLIILYVGRIVVFVFLIIDFSVVKVSMVVVLFCSLFVVNFLLIS